MNHEYEKTIICKATFTGCAMPKKLISDASRQSSVTRKKHVTILASVIRANQ
jgi:hypothetical protein